MEAELEGLCGRLQTISLETLVRMYVPYNEKKITFSITLLDFRSTKHLEGTMSAQAIRRHG